jgi:hypothetical protein
MRMPRPTGAFAVIWVALLALVGVVTIIACPKEPSYNGKPLSYWLSQLPATVVSGHFIRQQFPQVYDTTQEAEADRERRRATRLEAGNAVDVLGTNCVRALIARMGSTDSRTKLILRRYAMQFRVLARTDMAPAVQRRGQALTALLDLGTHAKSAVPDLLLLARSNSPEVRAGALCALRNVAPGEYKRLEREGQISK